MEILKLMEYMESIGYGLSLEGDQLRINRGKHLPPQLKEQIRQNKFTIIDIFERNCAARECGLLIGISGTLYFRAVSKQSTVYIEEIKNKWIAWRETYQIGKESSVRHRVIVEADTFNYVLLEVKSFFDYIDRKRRVI